MRTLLLAALLLAVDPVRASGAPGQATRAQEGPAVDVHTLLDASEWPAMLSRDARLSFTSGSARLAREDLERGLAAPLYRAFAFVGLASGGDITDRPTLEVGAAEGETIERQGAVLALGELRPSPIPLLRKLAADDDAGVAAAAVVALARTGEASARRDVEAWADGSGPLATTAKAALAFSTGLAADSPGGAVELFLNLRWAAARRYGFVDGTRWQAHLEADLARNEAFLDRVIIGASVYLREAPRKDHLLEITVGGGTPDRLRGVALGMPKAFATLVASGLWKPENDDEWRAVLQEIKRRGVREEDIPLLTMAATESGVVRDAGLLLVSANVKEGFALIEDDLFAPEPELRLAVAEAMGGLADKTRVPDISRLRRDQDPGVRAAALIALVRHKDQPSIDILNGLIEGGPSPARSQAIQMLCRASLDKQLSGYIESVSLLEGLEPDELLLVQVSLSRAGRMQPKEALRENLMNPAFGPGLLELIVRSLAETAVQEDLVILRELFPVEDAFELNVALATALVAHRDRGAHNLLRQATWRGPWNRSVLAAGLLVRHGGIKTLHDELASPPARVTESDLRRVGFALGEWGGLTEVDVLARRRRSGDPALQGAFLGALATRTH